MTANTQFNPIAVHMMTDGFKQLIDRLKKVRETRAKRGSSGTAVVTYGMEYAPYVHEIGPTSGGRGGKGNYHEPPTQWKFLETPARENKNELIQIFLNNVMAGVSVEQAIVRAAERLKELSQRICPIHTGQLRNSADARLLTLQREDD